MNLLKLMAGAALLASLTAAPAFAADAIAPQTRENLLAAMHGEAFANLKYRRFAEVARESGNESLAKLFEESANVEANEHFDREADALRLGGANAANLLDAMAGEKYENKTMYVEFAAQADKAGDAKTAAMFRQIAEDEGDHYARYKAAHDELAGK